MAQPPISSDICHWLDRVARLASFGVCYNDKVGNLSARNRPGDPEMHGLKIAGEGNGLEEIGGRIEEMFMAYALAIYAPSSVTY
jgi:hypothetical protein